MMISRSGTGRQQLGSPGVRPPGRNGCATVPSAHGTRVSGLRSSMAIGRQWRAHEHVSTMSPDRMMSGDRTEYQLWGGAAPGGVPTQSGSAGRSSCSRLQG